MRCQRSGLRSVKARSSGVSVGGPGGGAVWPQATSRMAPASSKARAIATGTQRGTTDWRAASGIGSALAAEAVELPDHLQVFQHVETLDHLVLAQQRELRAQRGFFQYDGV